MSYFFTKLTIMRKLTFYRIKAVILFLFILATTSYGQEQSSRKIDWSKDTISSADVKGAKDTYLNIIRGGGQKNATEQITLPVDKLKEVMDACAANNVTEVVVYIISLRQNDLARYRRMNPEFTGPDDQLKGSQTLVFKVPRSAFADVLTSKAKSSGNPLMMSLMAAGLLIMDSPYTDLPPADKSVYLTLGKICPPPASCNK